MNLLDKLQGKKILFFSVRTFNLEKEIKTVMEKYGAQVTFFDERPNNSHFAKGIIRVKRDVYKKRINAYYRKIFKEISDTKFDFLFVNRGEVITEEFLKDFIAAQPQCERIFYTWDSFKNHGHPLSLLTYFHKRFTFDCEDAAKYNIGFRPLFFIDSYKNVKKKSRSELKYNLLFVGTAHSDRYLISSEIAEWCKKNSLTAYTYYYMQGRAVYWYRKLLDKSFKKFDYKKLTFKSLSTAEIIHLYEDSDVILDINHPGQKGLTMRTLEALGSGKKLITTNPEIVRYPFYNPNNYLLIDRYNIRLEKKFFQNDYQPVSTDLYSKCSVDGWLADVFIRDEKDDWKSLMSTSLS